MNRYFSRKITVYLLLVGIISVFGCGQSNEERRAAREAEWAQRRNEIAKEEAKLRDQLESRHGKLRLFPGTIRSNAYTYELQQFFNTNRNTNIIFKGHLEDIEKTETGTIAKFSSLLGEDTIVSPTVIIFRLKVKDEQIPALLQADRFETFYRSFRFLLEPRYMVVAQIDSVSRIRRYEFASSGSEEEDSAEVDVDVPIRFLAHGHLLEAAKREIKEK